MADLLEEDAAGGIVEYEEQVATGAGDREGNTTELRRLAARVFGQTVHRSPQLVLVPDGAERHRLPGVLQPVHRATPEAAMEGRHIRMQRRV
ncbi:MULTISPECIES: hypothetical protein [Kitasatospora]|uniref:hypothetical protein n=1 Tax=Kitasatospora TaxID=2063 RepID=UPI000C702017|nr:hypothetical protein [Kitasatospora sp. GP30]MDH6145043.1 hypothetical protein [Kitasatospora sp. GP30]